MIISYQQSFGMLLRSVTCLGLCNVAVLGQQTAPRPTLPAERDPVVITVGPTQIRAHEFELLLDGITSQDRTQLELHRRAVAQQLGKLLALVQAAEHAGIQNTGVFQAQMRLIRDKMLARAITGKLSVDSKPSDAEMQAYYRAHLADFAAAKVRQILIADTDTPNPHSTRTPAEAEAKAERVAARLRRGASWAEVAEKDSDDLGSKHRGGELGLIRHTIPEFEKPMSRLPVGTVSEPIHTSFGYHVIEVESRQTMAFSKVEPEIADIMSRSRLTQMLTAIENASPTVLNDNYFGPAPPGATTPGAANPRSAATLHAN